MSLSDKVKDQIGLPCGIRATARGFHNGENLSCGNAGSDGISNAFSADKKDKVLHFFLLSEGAYDGYGEEIDRVLMNTIHKSVSDYAARHARDFFKGHERISKEELPVLYLFPISCHIAHRPPSYFESHRGLPTLPEGVYHLHQRQIPIGKKFMITTYESKRITEEAKRNALKDYPSISEIETEGASDYFQDHNSDLVEALRFFRAMQNYQKLFGDELPTELVVPEFDDRSMKETLKNKEKYIMVFDKACRANLAYNLFRENFYTLCAGRIIEKIGEDLGGK